MSLLYHGTSSLYLDDILKNGIRARGRKRGNWKHTVLSSSKHVYLTTCYAPYFAIVAAAETEGDPVVIEVDTMKMNLYDFEPDEDFLAYAKATEPHIEGLKERSAYFRTRLDRYGHAYQMSLDSMGTCAHRGTIMPNAITRVVGFTPKQMLHFSMAVMDPSISPINYKFCGKKYRALTKWLMGYDLGVDRPLVNTGDIAKFMPTEFPMPEDAERDAIRVLYEQGQPCPTGTSKPFQEGLSC